jgi:glycosyltransferase involved in cell wall biosynthesis
VAADVQPVRLLQAGKAYHPHIGGIETVMRHVAEGAARARWDSRVLVAGDRLRTEQQPVAGVDVVRTASAGRVLSLPLAPGYGRALRREAADALIVHEPTLLAALATLGHRREIRRRFGRILVWWHSDIVRQGWAGPAYRPVLDGLLDVADEILVATPNHVTSSDTLPRYRDKTTVVPYGIDVARYEMDPERAARVAARRAGLPDAPLVVYAGRLARYKGIGELVAAMELVPNAHLVVAGRGPCEPLVRESELHRAGRVTLLPHLDDEAFADLMWAADVFALPSTQPSEAFGIVQLEAMVCGTPVVSFDLPTGVTWVNRHGETGLVAPLGDVSAYAAAIRELLDDDALRSRLGQQAQDRVTRELTVDHMVERTLERCGARSGQERVAPAGVPAR